MTEVLTTALPGLAVPQKGKVREVYDLGQNLLIVCTDRISAFDVVMENGIPGKGRVLNQMSAFWFDLFSNICPNHIVSTSDSDVDEVIGSEIPELKGRCTIAKKAVPLTIECVARGYISGSLFKEYRKFGGNIHGLSLPEGLVESDELPEPIFTPATKAQSGHDENISFSQASDIVGVEVASQVRDWTLEIYRRARDVASSKNIILADTKFEFGQTDSGLIWIDEALTPDSSRFWEASKYLPGRAQPSFDKQFVRDYLETLDWDKSPPGPRLPDDVVEKTLEKYVSAYRQLTGREIDLSE